MIMMRPFGRKKGSTEIGSADFLEELLTQFFS